ncbi:contact-dependent growth inhibition system immunity protein [Roseateles aquatilis]|uniref:contact-dependent growth inhibition system immunity protein n=1 Tax=Roseateles aquatilis TaxID=431061 RepID=UPI001303DB30
MTTNSNQELKSFLAGYFHEDWELDASEPDEVIVQFLSGGPDSNDIYHIVAQIRQYLVSAGDDVAIEQDLLREFGCYYLPSSDGQSARDWLQHVVGKLEYRQGGLA